jgi:polar amino acid transport system substrate-binding protein
MRDEVQESVPTLRSPLFPIAILVATFAGCGLPMDPDGTLNRVRGGTLRVGLVHHPPWVDIRQDRVLTGREVTLVKELARDLGSKIEWVEGWETALMLELERRRLDLVVGGIPEKTAWQGKVGLSRPHARSGTFKMVLASPPGENDWLLFLDRWIAGRAEAKESGS